MLRCKFALLSALIAVPLSAQKTKPDFSGTWVMDTARSESMHQGIALSGMTLVIKQGPSDVSIETQKADTNKAEPSVETLHYRLDGTEVSTTSEGGAAVKTRGRWDGSKLIIETARNVHGAAVTLTHVLGMTPGSRELTVDKTLTVQHGYQSTGARNSGTGRDIFVKASSVRSRAKTTASTPTEPTAPPTPK